MVRIAMKGQIIEDLIEGKFYGTLVLLNRGGEYHLNLALQLRG